MAGAPSCCGLLQARARTAQPTSKPNPQTLAALAISLEGPAGCCWFATAGRLLCLPFGELVLHPLDEGVVAVLLDDAVKLVLVVVHEARALGHDVDDLPPRADLQEHVVERDGLFLGLFGRARAGVDDHPFGAGLFAEVLHAILDNVLEV